MTAVIEHPELEELRRENKEFRERLQIAEVTLHAIERGEVEALVAHTPGGIEILTLPETVQLQASRYATLLATTQDGYWVFDADARLLDVNDAYCQMSGYSRAELLQMRIPDLEARETPEETAEHIRKVKTSQFDRFESQHRRKDGSILEVEISVSYWKPQEQFLLFVRDITDRKRAEEAVCRIAAYHHSLIEANPDSLVILDPDGRIMDVNAAMEQATSRARRELIGTEFACCFTRLDLARQGCEQVFREGTVRDYPLELRHANGHVTPVVYNASVYRDEKGTVLGAIAVARDVTQLRQTESLLQHKLEELQAAKEELRHNYDALSEAQHVIEEERRIYRDLFTLAPVGYLVTSPTGIIEKANDGVALLIRCPPATLTGMLVFGYVAAADREKLKQSLRDLCEGRRGCVQDLEIGLGSRRPVPIPCAMTISAIRSASGTVTSLRWLVADITERKQAEQKLHQLNADLEQRVKDRTAELEASNQEMEAFAYSVSHDLRAPLRAIDGFSQILLKEHAQALPEKPRHYLQVVCDNVRQMGRLIDDILRLSRLGRQSLLVQSMDPAALVRQCLRELQAEQEGRRVEIQVGELPPCWADGNLLKQVWLNLLSNALKFSRTRDPARMEVGSAARDGETVYFIKDNGVGFDMQYAGKLFGVFQRLHPQEQYEGTGIGLALVKRILDRHGGRIWAEAQPDQGATFYFTLGRRASHA